MEPNQLVFTIESDKTNEPIEIIKLSKDGFYYRGKRVDDIHNVYERFNDWLKMARKEDITNLK